jgi:uncharacterized membrane protein
MKFVPTIQLIFCGLLAVFFLLAGISHFTAVDEFVKIVPPFLPFPKLIVQVTGVMEIIFAVGLIWPKYRRQTGILLSLFLIAVLPANIYMAVADIPFNGRDLTDFQLWFRVVLQFPLIALVLWASGFRKKTP